jgi:hypothetical protein
MNAVEPVSTIVERLVREFREAAERITAVASRAASRGS